MGTIQIEQFSVSLYYRRSCSLDVEISASGFTKDFERDAALLHPAGPESEEEDDSDEEKDEEEGREEENGAVQGRGVRYDDIIP